jgi:hypothetical protein
MDALELAIRVWIGTALILSARSEEGALPDTL